MFNNRPAYGTIPALGGEWFITFYKETDPTTGSAITGTSHGYGEFPFADFPNLPVIDFRTSDRLRDALRFNSTIEETAIVTDYDRTAGHVMPLSEYLNRIAALGFKIYNWPAGRQEEQAPEFAQVVTPDGLQLAFVKPDEYTRPGPGQALQPRMF